MVLLVRWGMLWFLILLRLLRIVVKLIIKIYWQGFGWVKSRYMWVFTGGLANMVPV